MLRPGPRSAPPPCLLPGTREAAPVSASTSSLAHGGGGGGGAVSAVVPKALLPSCPLPLPFPKVVKSNSRLKGSHRQQPCDLHSQKTREARESRRPGCAASPQRSAGAAQRTATGGRLRAVGAGEGCGYLLGSRPLLRGPRAREPGGLCAREGGWVRETPCAPEVPPSRGHSALPSPSTARGCRSRLLPGPCSGHARVLEPHLLRALLTEPGLMLGEASLRGDHPPRPQAGG